jgi:hypothetical protein
MKIKTSTVLVSFSIWPLNPAGCFKIGWWRNFRGIDLRQRQVGSQCFSDARIEGTGSSSHDGLEDGSNESVSAFMVSASPLAR